jgi:hypothetical protein
MRRKQYQRVEMFVYGIMALILHSASYAVIASACLVVQLSSSSKASYLRVHVRVQEDVAWFQIQMENVLFMQVIYAVGPCIILKRVCQSCRDPAKYVRIYKSRKQEATSSI